MIHTAALLERCEKQALLARHARRVVELLDDTAVVPGDAPPPFQHGEQARLIMAEAEEELKTWTPSWEEHAGAQRHMHAPEATETGGYSDGQMMQSPTQTSAIQQAPTEDELYAYDEQGSLQPSQNTVTAGVPPAAQTATEA